MMARGVLLVFSVLCGLFGGVSCSQRSTEATAVPAAASTAVAVPDAGKLTGRWLRPDGGYVLEIGKASSNGKLEAAYFNPNPINVAQAEWRVSAQNLLIVSVELRDLNYPGATYTLRYDATADRLQGAYYQPVHQQTYEIEFIRQQP